MSRFNARVTLPGRHSLPGWGVTHRSVQQSARSIVTLALLVCSVLTFGCASRQQVAKLEDRLVSMDDTLQQLAAGQDISRADTAARIDLIEDYLAADGKEKARLLQELKSQRQLRTARTTAMWTPPATPNSAEKNGAGQQIPPAPAPVTAPAPILAPAAPVETVRPAADAPAVSPAPAPAPEPAVAQMTPAPAPAPAHGSVAATPLVTEPEVIKRGVSKPTAGYAGQAAGDAAASAPGMDLDPNRIVSKPIYQPNSPGASAAAAGKPALAKAEPSRAGTNSENSYEEALKLVQAGKSDRARQLLTAFIQENPKSALLPNAYYWLGETYYQDKRYAQAILTFKDVTAKFPKHGNAAAALLKIGYSYEQLGDKPNARFYLGTLVKEYPRSESAAQAREALQGRLK
ncbi:tol-pal system protein YbgF [Megalodesulfovibrio paquesii]